MFNCHHLTHPYLNDPGTSQEQRLPVDLQEGAVLIDDRQVADILNYFSGLSRQINFYDENLAVTDWEPFFSGDLAFSLSGISGYNLDAVKMRLASYAGLFARRPAKEGLQLLLLYTFYATLYPIQQWSILLKGSTLPLEQGLQTLIKDRLPKAVKTYIVAMNTAANCFCIRPVDMQGFLANDAWGLTVADLSAYDPGLCSATTGRRKQLLALSGMLLDQADIFTEVIRHASTDAAAQVNDDLYGLLQVSGQQDIAPHLALLYSFVNQFLHVLDNLNQLTQGHLNFFFQNVLQLSPGDMTPDKAYIIFGLQKKVPQYLLDAGLQLKNGKDSKQTDVFFTLDAPIMVTQAQVADIRTLFLNKQEAGDATYIEGVYMAPDATKADGLSQAFKDPAQANWPTLGAKRSRYTPPGAVEPADYSAARMGFVLASKIFLMEEGNRKVHIRLACQWRDLCQEGSVIDGLFEAVEKAVCARWLIVTQTLIDQAVVLGLKSSTALLLREYYLRDDCIQPLCGGDERAYKSQALIRLPCCGLQKYSWEDDEAWGLQEEADRACEEEVRLFWENEMRQFPAMEDWELAIFRSLLVEQWIFRLLFSGDKGWVAPDKIDGIQLEWIDETNGLFLLHIRATILPGPVITFYDKDKLGEDFRTTDPLVKIQLNDSIKVEVDKVLREKAAQREQCCLYQPVSTCGKMMSLYTFFRNVIVIKCIPLSGEWLKEQLDGEELCTGVRIRVCGLAKGLVVQNDDGVLNASSPFTPFGVKPVVPDFDVYLSPEKRRPFANLIGPNFYVGCREALLKKWQRINLNINWKGKPSHLYDYYSTYFLQDPNFTRRRFPWHQVNLALLHKGSFRKEYNPDQLANPYSTLNSVTQDYNRRFFDKERRIGSCHSSEDYRYCFDVRPWDFGTDYRLQYDSAFAPFTKYAPGMDSGFIRITMENQDFLHKIYTLVLARQMTLQAATPNTTIPLPNEPWTPTITNMSLDYEARASIGDMQLLQLYPYDGTSLSVDILGEPSLFARFCDEGNLFVGIKDLVPGDGLSILVQLAEATADTEGLPGVLSWQYLSGNQWRDLRTGFEIVEDDTHTLTTTGILKFQFPDDISENNTLMPAGFYWIKASLPDNTAAISSTLAILAQAAPATYAPQPTNDPARAATPLDADSLSKLAVPDASVAKVGQPYLSFGGRAPEASGPGYLQRVSEQLRHKGRAIQKWDYERLVLGEYPKLWLVKCINHSYSLDSRHYKWDFPMAPGNILLAVLPDPAKLKVVDAYQPTVPLSILNDIESWLANRCPPFVRLFVRNPRYEPVDICITVTLKDGTNSEYLAAQLQQDIRGFMAPWKDGDLAAFQFGQRLYLSDLVDFVENRDYIGYVLRLRYCHSGERMEETPPAYLDPLTPRSILTAGRISVEVRQEGKDLIWKKRIKNTTGNGKRSNR